MSSLLEDVEIDDATFHVCVWCGTRDNLPGGNIFQVVSSAHCEDLVHATTRMTRGARLVLMLASCSMQSTLCNVSACSDHVLYVPWTLSPRVLL